MIEAAKDFGPKKKACVMLLGAYSAASKIYLLDDDCMQDIQSAYQEIFYSLSYEDQRELYEIEQRCGLEM